MVDCWLNNKQKEDDVENLFVGATFCGEVSESDNKEDLIEWLGESIASLHITYTKKNMTNIK